MRLKLTIAYDGAPYKGWQYQPGMVTVQETLEGAISAIAKAPVKVHGSGRTDAGVHALGQVAHFDAPTGSKMKAQNWLLAVNTRLPSSIRIMGCEEVAEDFHARFSAVSKTYEYRLETAAVLPPHDAGRAWHEPRPLNIGLLTAALQTYVGEHDFRHFSALRGNESAETSYLRHITEASVTPLESQLILRFSANGFLYKMVRILTGVAVSVGRERVSLEELSAMLMGSEGDFHTTKLCAPPDGLSLQKVIYP